MDTTKIACTAPGCKKCLPPEAMWLPERKARQAANGGTRVEPADFPRFALCGYHGHLLRKSAEIKVYRYLSEVEYERKADERRKAEETTWKPFAELFAPKATQRGKDSGQPRKPNGVRLHTGPGQGLSRCSKADAEKRLAKEQQEKDG